MPRLVIARTLRERMIGLLRHRGLDEDQGLLILSCNSIHTFGMRFTIDAVFLDGQGSAVRLKPNIPPGRLVWPVPRAVSVVELPAGRLFRVPLELGHHLSVIADIRPRG